jgi:chitinase
MPRSTVRVAVALPAIALLLPILSLVAARASSVDRPVSKMSAIAGERVAIRGAVPQRVRRPVALQRRVGGHWHQVDRARTSRAGRYSFELRARGATYRVVARSVQAGRERLPAWTSRRTTVAPQVQTGSLRPPVATFTPVRRGRPVVLQVARANGWTTVARATQDARGHARFTMSPTARTTYRAVAERWHGAPAVTTAAATITGPSPTGRKPWVTGYYAAWFWEWLYPPEEVDMTAMTHFVFGRVAPGGGSLGGDPTELMDGAWSAQEPDRAPDGSGDSIEDYLVGRAHAAGTKALLMLGGDGADGRGFLKSTATPQLQGEFVDNVVDYLVEHDYDGVDLDWENCLDGHPDCVDEGEDPVTAGQAQQRLLGLIDAIRVEMATRERYAATPGLLTFPGYAIKINENGGRPEPWQTEVALKVDQYNLMTYGVGTTWNGGGWLSWFSGALFGAGGLNPVDISSSVAAYQASGVPRDRIGIGIGFYGIYYGPGITAPRQSTDGNGIYEVQDAPLSYSELDRLGYLTHGTRHWDEVAKSAYHLYDGGYVPALDSGRSPAGLLSYEDEQSIAAKGNWVKDTGVGGTILWTINYGWLPRTGTNPLMDAVKESFLE